MWSATRNRPLIRIAEYRFYPAIANRIHFGARRGPQLMWCPNRVGKPSMPARIVAAKLATLKHGGDRTKSPFGDLPGMGAPVAVTQATAAELLNVGKRSVERARQVIDAGAPNSPSQQMHCDSSG